MLRFVFNLLILTLLIHSQLYTQGFTNIAADYGLDHQYNTVEYGAGVSFVDFNQDGMDDITFATEHGENLLFSLNTGDGYKQIDALINDSSAIKQVLWVDYNNDGELDLYIGGESHNRLFKNTGDLVLIDVTEQLDFEFPLLTSYCATWFDYNSDGKLDLLVAHRTEEETGWVDLYRNVDDGSFVKQTLKAGLEGKGNSVLAMTILDYNNDGWQDIFLGQDWEQGNQLLKNNGNGTFKDVSNLANIDYKMNSMTATVVDINRDMWQDLYVTNTTSGNILLINDGNGHFFEDSERYNLNIRNVTFGAIFFDADNDGDEDVHIAGMQSNFSLEKISETKFIKRNIDWGMSTDNQFNNGVAMGDIDGDGFVDFVKNSVTRKDIFNSNHSLWHNQFKDNNYIKIELEGTVSNTFGIGAKIKVYSNNQVQLKRLACGESFSSQHSLIQHFGVGTSNIIDSISVFWPSGNISTIKDVNSNITKLIKEPTKGCMDMDACNFSAEATESNGLCRYPELHYDCFGCINDMDNDGVCDELEILGCTDQEACNFSVEATENDGSCLYLEPKEIQGETRVNALHETTYKYLGPTTSHYDWTIENGSIIFGHGTSTVTVIWYENEKGKLTVQEKDSEGCTGSLSSIEVIIEEKEGTNFLDIKITPNPVRDFITISGLTDQAETLNIYNSSGKLIFSSDVQATELSIDMQVFPVGMYLIRITGSEINIIEKIFKRN